MKYIIPILGLVILLTPFLLPASALQWVAGIIGALIILFVGLAAERVGLEDEMKVVLSIFALIVLLAPFLLTGNSIQLIEVTMGVLIVILTVAPELIRKVVK